MTIKPFAELTADERLNIGYSPFMYTDHEFYFRRVTLLNGQELSGKFVALTDAEVNVVAAVDKATGDLVPGQQIAFFSQRQDVLK